MAVPPIPQSTALGAIVFVSTICRMPVAISRPLLSDVEADAGKKVPAVHAPCPLEQGIAVGRLPRAVIAGAKEELGLIRRSFGVRGKRRKKETQLGERTR